MDYLVELYNKHIEENTGQKYYLNERNVKDRLDSLLILRYFIKWLVENDKIDIEKIENSEYYLIDWFYYNERKKFGIEWLDDVEKILLMLLSISSSPIDDLVSYLK